jgi:hypothetical protein
VKDMNVVRKVAIAAVAATLSVGLLGISAPAHADSSWGTRVGGPHKIR